MATIFNDWRPSALAHACVPNALANPAQASALGQLAVLAPLAAMPAPVVRVKVAPTFGALPASGATLKINNYMGTFAAAAAAIEGATTSSLSQMLPATRAQKVQDDKVKGGDARGIPPRGMPV